MTTTEQILMDTDNILTVLNRVRRQLMAIDSGASSDGISLTAEQIANLKAQVKAAHAQGLLAATAIGKAIEDL